MGRVRRLTPDERTVLREVGEPGEGPIADSVFAECIRQGWGPDHLWYVTARGRRALAIDLLADAG